MLLKGKYLVFKAPVDGMFLSDALDEETYFLLRDQDALATMTLRSYVSNVLQVLDWGRDPTTGKPLTDEQREQLSLRADGAHLLAERWSKKPHKIPD